MDGDQIESLMNLNLFSPGRRPPSISPDEAVIRRRGKRKVPLSFSPEKAEQMEDTISDSSPTPYSAKKVCKVSPGELRVKPKPRKLFSDDESTKLVIEEGNGNTESDTDHLNITSIKTFGQTEINLNHNNNVGKTEDHLNMVKVLSQEQLVKVLTDLAEQDIFTKRRVAELLPVQPDISRKIANLEEMKLNIFKALPKSRLTNHRDSLSFKQVSVHVKAFGKVLQEDIHQLVQCEHWPTVVRYVMTVWPIVNKTPEWDDPAHNKTKIDCFKILAIATKRAIENYKFDFKTKKNLLELMNSSNIGEIQSFCNVLSSTLEEQEEFKI